MAGTATTTDIGLAARFSALASLGAAVVHVAVVPAHWREWVPAGMFFVVLALFQLIWARAVLTRTTAPVLIAGIALNAGAVALWASSRTVGAPFGPHAGQAELVAAADLCAALLQIYVVMGAGWVWHRGRRGGPIPAAANVALSLGALTVVALASTVGVASGLRHGHHGPAEAHHGHQPMPPAVAPGPAEVPIIPAPPPPTAQPSHDGHGDHHH
ncbi:hypothetical protein [Mycobacterium sp. PS03-16]|uniref:hypothetical protein n=1 Tax=Mycobacterium sp. PS03-16 TaxID=2559611 RepID=UPI001FD7C26B|nr:hypothetical protein [Mycobacterium sp. PS03-16]